MKGLMMKGLMISQMTFPPKLIGQLLLLGHDAGGIDGHEEEVRLLWGLCATGAVQQKLVHKDLKFRDEW